MSLIKKVSWTHREPCAVSADEEPGQMAEMALDLHQSSRSSWNECRGCGSRYLCGVNMERAYPAVAQSKSKSFWAPAALRLI